MIGQEPPTPGTAATVPVLQVTDLHVTYPGETGPVHAVRGLSYAVRPGEVLGIVGESGAGKSAAAQAVLGLLPDGTEVRGSVELDGRELLGLDDAALSEIRGNGIGMVFQDPLSALTPVYSVGNQLVEALRVHQDLSRKAARTRAVELLDLVGIPDPHRRADAFPHEFSGGMRQRAVIAMAIANDPRVIVADEPTTALDVTIQAQILDVLKTAREVTGAAIVLITHDLGVVAGFADRVQVMYAGRPVEYGTVDEIYYRPRMPYTIGLLGATPRLDGPAGAPLVPIHGAPPSLSALPPGCPFAPRCPVAVDRCRETEPAPARGTDAGHTVACHRGAEIADGSLPRAGIFGAVRGEGAGERESDTGVPSPARTHAAGAQPARTDSAPTELAPTEPTPADSAPADSAPTGLEPADPAPTNSAPAGSAPTDSAPTTPAPPTPAPPAPAPANRPSTRPNRTASTPQQGVTQGWPAGTGPAAPTLLQVTALTKHFPQTRRTLLKRPTGTIRAVDGIDLAIREGETLALVGESGCGKTTTLLEIMDLAAGQAGTVRLFGQDVRELDRAGRKRLRRDLQIVFQDPTAALDPRMPVGDILAEPLRTHRVPRDRIAARVPELLELVGLAADDAGRYPREFSGGQRQRIAIARALALEPRLLVLDEPVSALDVSVQAGVLNLLDELKARLRLSYLLVAHDLSVVRHSADRVAVMYLGRIVESGGTAEVFAAPSHPYTRALLSAVPLPDPRKERARTRVLLSGDLPSPADVPSGCRFRSRCPLYATLGAPEQRRCREDDPLLRPVPTGPRTAGPGTAGHHGTDGHTSACHHPAPPPGG
ncbi:dipeptide ABC transporter ATP-binding protein [Streptomyces rimosus]|uniref:dipeptide ABC transporter ATP-binding protein n=1 Tax=Streptomyces rimosus TaxID=1927 RepID=UPI00067D3A5D|nr:dipeptide ABC transporter ATP-binding protein [Streptomyces rimosus]